MQCTTGMLLQAESSAFTEAEVKRAEAAALLERRMAAMQAVMASRRNPPAQAVEPQAARGPGADLRFQVRPSSQAQAAVPPVPWLMQSKRRLILRFASQLDYGSVTSGLCMWQDTSLLSVCVPGTCLQLGCWQQSPCVFMVDSPPELS